MAISRRAFLGGTTRGLLALGAGAHLRGAAADISCEPWGALPDPAAGGVPVGASAEWTCANHAGYKILEIWLEGGASPWETFWIPGTPGSPDLSAFGLDALPLTEIDWTAGAKDSDPCTDPGMPSSFDELYEFGESADSKAVFLGPAAKPLWSRPDIVDRTRLLGLGHPLLPHQAATPYGLAGLPLGNPRRAGTGTAIQRRHVSMNPGTVQPVSYVFHKNRRHVADMAVAIGAHPGSARPLMVSVGSSDSLAAQLDRDAVNPASDALFDALRHDFTGRMRWQDAAVRSSGFESYRIAAELLADASVLQGVFDQVVLSVGNTSAVCPRLVGMSAAYNPQLVTEINAASHLLSQDLARYACVVDYGIADTYDTHPGTEHALIAPANLLHVCRQLARVIHHPVHNPTGTIDLADTLIVVNSEFGRTPEILNGGRNHWPDGYVSVLIGGPITPATAGVRGGFDAAGVTLPFEAYTPTDLRGAMLLAGGVDAFAPDTFRVDDFSPSLRGDAYTEDGIRSRLVEVGFGL